MDTDDLEKKGLGSGRWHWEALKKATTKEEADRILAEVVNKVGNEDVTLNITLPGAVYVRIMGNAWIAHQFGETPEVSIKAYLDRAFQVTEFYLKSVAAKKR